MSTPRTGLERSSSPSALSCNNSGLNTSRCVSYTTIYKLCRGVSVHSLRLRDLTIRLDNRSDVPSVFQVLPYAVWL